MSAGQTITVTLDVRVSKGFPLPYHEIVAETTASDEGDKARVGIAMNFGALYVWINGEMHIVSMEKLLNAIIPELLPVQVKLTKAGRAALAKYERKNAGGTDEGREA